MPSLRRRGLRLFVRFDASAPLKWSVVFKTASTSGRVMFLPSRGLEDVVSLGFFLICD